MKIPVLTYQSGTADGKTYAGDHRIALASDIYTIACLGLRIVSLEQVVDALLSSRLQELGNCVAISFNQGTRVDVESFAYRPGDAGNSFLNVLETSGAGRFLHATSFAIASGEALRDSAEAVDKPSWWAANWWSTADRSGLIKVENGGWNQGRVPINDLVTAQAQIGRASKRIETLMGPGYCSLYAYQDGQANSYLRHEYFPRHYAEHQIRAAFTTDARPLSQDDDRWALPRFVCSRDWDSPEALRRLLL